MSILTEDLSAQEIFLLVLVKSGFLTTYDLLSQIGLGVGASSPALKRMEKQGLLTCTLGPRNRMQFAMTADGEKQLKAAIEGGPMRYWRRGRRDSFDSLHRAIFLAWIDSSPEDARFCVDQTYRDLGDRAEREMRKAAEFRKSALRLRDDMMKGTVSPDNGRLIASVYCWIEATMDTAQYRLQAEALKDLDTLIADLPPPPKIWTEDSGSQQIGSELR